MKHVKLLLKTQRICKIYDYNPNYNQNKKSNNNENSYLNTIKKTICTKISAFKQILIQKMKVLCFCCAYLQ